ncbi:unnamed protein product [Haemonchus placei]|uniref:Uncharacterized protein n=1 Tax=Haemonchus placei TaxID=6290 RepID=A0A0N4W498_HAEPC|nr:unnamed protein product [Haemonchus placei]
MPEEQSKQWGHLISSWTTTSFTLPRLLTDHTYSIEGITLLRRLSSSKSRLAPLNKAITIPRLELAALMTGNKELPIFDRIRVKIIQDDTSDVIVRHIPGHLNPADIGARGATTHELLSSTRWCD